VHGVLDVVSASLTELVLLLGVLSGKGTIVIGTSMIRCAASRYPQSSQECRSVCDLVFRVYGWLDESNGLLQRLAVVTLEMVRWTQW